MVRGYPRAVIHRKVTELAAVFLRVATTGKSDEQFFVFPTSKYANECRTFLLTQSPHDLPPLYVWQAHFSARAKGDPTGRAFDLHGVFFPSSVLPIAKQFWGHTGFGVSSRVSQRSLELLAETRVLFRWSRIPNDLEGSIDPEEPVPQVSLLNDIPGARATESAIETGYMNGVSTSAKRILRSDGYLAHPSHTAVAEVCEDDVFLYPTGMTAIWHTHQLVISMVPAVKCVFFSFPYIDALKTLQRWGSGCHFLGHDPKSDMKRLEALLASSPDTPPISALFCEIPSNPRLQSPRLDRLRALADKYNFLIVLDNTIGTSVNVNVLSYVDTVATSSSKFVSGYADVLGGNLVLSPRMRHYDALKAAQASVYTDTYYDEDAATMECNSRNFISRVKTINTNTDFLCEYLRSRSWMASPDNKNLVIKEIFCPKWVNRQEYDLCRLRHYADGEPALTNFGGLFSLTFVSDLASHTFFDALPCAKGPSLGTYFTLVCPYTILAHYPGREWAAEYGIEEGLVRVSVGLEDHVGLMADFDGALREAEEAVKLNRG